LEKTFTFNLPITDYKIMKRSLILFFSLALLGVSCSKIESIDYLSELRPTSGIEDKTIYYGQATFAFEIDDNYYNNNKVYLNGVEEAIPTGGKIIPYYGYYELMQVAFDDDQLPVDTSYYDFVVADSDSSRANTEWGLPTYSPQINSFVDYTSVDISSVYYKNKTDLVAVPFLLKATDANGLRNDFARVSYDGNKGKMKKGIYAGFIDADSDVSCTVGSVSHTMQFTQNENSEIILQEQLSENLVIPANSVVMVNTDVIVNAAVTVGEGVLFVFEEGKQITVNGKFMVSATEENPALFAPKKDKTWKGIVVDGGELDVNNAIFTGCKGNGDGVAGLIPVIEAKAATALSVKNSYFVNNESAAFTIDACTANISNSYFVDNHAGIKVKNEGKLVFENSAILNVFVDEFGYSKFDCDAIQVENSTAIVKSSRINFVSDDAISCGTRNSGGTVEISDSEIGYCIHEGVKTVSNSGVSNVSVSNSTFFECGQAVELGGESVDNSINVSGCNISKCLVGVRYGESEEVDVQGKMVVEGSSIYDSYERPVWNKVRNENWDEKLENLTFTNSFSNQKVADYPELNK